MWFHVTSTRRHNSTKPIEELTTIQVSFLICLIALWNPSLHACFYSCNLSRHCPYYSHQSSGPTWRHSLFHFILCWGRLRLCLWCLDKHWSSGLNLCTIEHLLHCPRFLSLTTNNISVYNLKISTIYCDYIFWMGKWAQQLMRLSLCFAPGTYTRQVLSHSHTTIREHVSTSRQVSL